LSQAPGYERDGAQILDEFLNALSKLGFKYEHHPDKFLIRIEGFAYIPLPMWFPMVIFHQGNKKRVEFYYFGVYIGVNIINFESSEVIDLKLPKDWKLKGKECCLEIYY